MSTVLLAGTGEVGIRAARQLVDTPGVQRLVVASRDPGRARGLARAMGARAEPFPDRGPYRDALGGVDAVAVATAAPVAAEWARAAVGAGVPVATIRDRDAGPSDAAAAAARTAVVAGCGLVPGLSDVLVRHAGAAFDRIHEVHVARAGAAGPACAEEVRGARREVPGEWRDGAWHAQRGFGPELLWFPEPVGARECQLSALGVAATVATVPTARYVAVRLAPPPRARRSGVRFRRDVLDEGWGAARIEVVGERDGRVDSIVYGVVDRVAVVAGVVLAVCALALAGAADTGVRAEPGVHALGELVTPVPFLAELARRGVKAAVFEGVAPVS